MAAITFITGTDTGVGKTVFTAHLLHALRRKGVNALAMKPFCSGSEEDVRVLQRVQRGQLKQRECNPYYFPEPLAPAVAAERHGMRLRAREVTAKIRKMAERCEELLVEGAGGVMVPVIQRRTFLDLLGSWAVGRVWVVSANRLGTLNHTLLTVRMLEGAGVGDIRVVLREMGPGKRDLSARSNMEVLKRHLGAGNVVGMPWLGSKPLEKQAFEKNMNYFQKVLAAI